MRQEILACRPPGGDPPAQRAVTLRGTTRRSAAQVAATAILDRAYGKAPTFSSTDTTQFKRAIDMTDDELAAIASGATLHVVK